jgi:opacity protein-like surface antigen
MINRFWGCCALAAAMVAGAGAAGAADLAVKAPAYKAPPPVILSDWAGFYLGIHGGYGWGDVSFDPPADPLNARPKGGVFGGHAGYNWQYGSVVTGLEVDYSGADLKDSSVVFSHVNSDGFGATVSREAKVDALASARARLGYVVLPNLLAYGTAGLGWGHSEVGLTASEVRRNTVVDSVSVTSDVNHFGWTAGAGLEYKVWGNFIARAEYLHYDLGKNTYNLIAPLNASTTVDVARGGLSYKF